MLWETENNVRYVLTSVYFSGGKTKSRRPTEMGAEGVMGRAPRRHGFVRRVESALLALGMPCGQGRD